MSPARERPSRRRSGDPGAGPARRVSPTNQSAPTEDDRGGSGNWERPTPAREEHGPAPGDKGAGDGDSDLMDGLG